MTEERTSYRILFVGDVFGRPGRKMLEDNLARLEWEHNIDFTIVNAENASGGRGLNAKGLHFFKELGVGALTMGNHTWDNKDIFNFIDSEQLLVRPLNYARSLPGVGYRFYSMGETKLAVVSLIGRLYMNGIVADCPFQAIEDALPAIKAETDIIFVDFHCEATSEKIAMGRFLEGRVSAVIGTHTHVQTNDARVLPHGTAYLTDAGMTGPRDSILGLAIPSIIEKFRTDRRFKFEIPDGDLQLNGAIVTVGTDGRAQAIELLNFAQEEF